MELENAQLLDYAVSRFQAGKYDEALEAFMLVYSRGYEQEWIIENIYSCYMWGNDDLFRKAYEQQTVNAEICYEDCLLDFVPYRDGEYYIFDKGIGIFRGKLSMDALEEAKLHAGIEKIEFGAVVFEMDWNWNDRLSILTAAKDRKIYVIGHDMQRLVSFYKIPELASYMKNIMGFSSLDEFQVYFHTNTSVYLPSVVLGNEEQKQELMNVIEREHQYRLTPEGRSTENVLLTIGIPTHDRGNLLLQRLENLRKMPYDAEIEIAISKNGTMLYQEEYREVDKLKDARISYYDHQKNLEGVVNWHYTIQMSHGKYVMLVSDEDDVCLDAIAHYLNLLMKFPDMVLCLAKGSYYYADVVERIYRKAGYAAFREVFLRTTYISGLIFRRKDFLQKDFLQLQKYVKNEFYHYYAHMWWTALICMDGDYMEEPMQLITQVDNVQLEEYQQYAALGKRDVNNYYAIAERLPIYATYEERMKQFEGQIEFLHIIEEKHPEVVEIGLIKAVGKQGLFFCIALQSHYKISEFLLFVDQFANVSVNAVGQFQLSEQQQLNVLNVIKDNIEYMIQLHTNLTQQERDD